VHLHEVQPGWMDEGWMIQHALHRQLVPVNSIFTKQCDVMLISTEISGWNYVLLSSGCKPLMELRALKSFLVLKELLISTRQSTVTEAGMWRVYVCNCRQFVAIISSLEHNRWFTRFSAAHIKLVSWIFCVLSCVEICYSLFVLSVFWHRICHLACKNISLVNGCVRLALLYKYFSFADDEDKITMWIKFNFSNFQFYRNSYQNLHKYCNK